MSARILRLLTDDLSAVDVASERPSSAEGFDGGLTDEACFTRMIVVERKRTERSGNPFLLMLIEGRESLRPVNGTQELLQKLVSVLKNSTRETDSVGWYEKDRAVGVIFTEVGAASDETMTAILAKIAKGLRSQLSEEQMARLDISLHRYPEEKQPPQRLGHLVLYPDLPRRDAKNRAGHFLKRTIDVVGSALLLILLSPLLLVIVLATKLTSRGPVLFKQKRIGQYGIPFTFLKFRSMHVDSDPGIHKEYVSRLISGEKGLHHAGRNECGGVYKITRDPRVTAVGRFLRRSSLDELPQLWNVFIGDMSLVGPRPPIPYEFECYDIWHRCRVWEAKPGITGLWQVTGRSRTSFDEMVRLDLQYVKSWSIWLDLKILLQTPRVVFSGDGAY
jgi:lipopolysaccharide/colanic/teichoic acid biosynthesis glycosyltransferase